MPATKTPIPAATDMARPEPKAKKAEKVKSTREKAEAPVLATEGDLGGGSEEARRRREKKERKEKKKEKRAKKALLNVKEESSTPIPAEQGSATAEEGQKPTKSGKKEKKEKKEKKRKHTDGESGTPQERPTKKPKSGGASGRVGPGAAYQQTESLASVSQAKVDDFLQTNHITISDGTGRLSHLRPVLEFQHLPQTPLLGKKPFATFKSPTPIQAASWPFTLSGRDVVGVAETGSGKTMAFALPCVYKVLESQVKGIKAAIVAPTRELAMQTHEQVSKLAELVGATCVCIYGGAPKDDQRRLLNRGADIVVATPGRLKDFMAEGSCDLSQVGFAVLDEADRMLDKGFEDDIKQILGSMVTHGQRQTLMFTATWPASVQALAATMMHEPVKVTIGSAKDKPDGPATLQANVRITQTVEVMEPYNKEHRLLQLIQQYQRSGGRDDRILVFCLYKKEAARVEATLRRKGVKVGGIHGDMNQSNRTAALAAFKMGKVPVLVATDVAARGLDIPEVKLVINCTFPLTIEDYVHRIGRTGRAGKTGEAITFFTKEDKLLSGALVNVLKATNQDVPEDLLKFGTTVKKKVHPIYGVHYREPAAEPSDVPAKITFDD